MEPKVTKEVRKVGAKDYSEDFFIAAVGYAADKEEAPDYMRATEVNIIIAMDGRVGVVFNHLDSCQKEGQSIIVVTDKFENTNIFESVLNTLETGEDEEKTLGLLEQTIGETAENSQEMDKGLTIYALGGTISSMGVFVVTDESIMGHTYNDTSCKGN